MIKSPYNFGYISQARKMLLRILSFVAVLVSVSIIFYPRPLFGIVRPYFGVNPFEFKGFVISLIIYYVGALIISWPLNIFYNKYDFNRVSSDIIQTGAGSLVRTEKK